MASIQRYTVRGKSYWRIVESRRVNGKPRAIPVLHLGTAEALLERLKANRSSSLSVRSYSHGELAALKALADKLKLTDIIDRYAEKGRRGGLVGLSLLTIAMNRLIEPHSKRGISDWVERTSLKRLYPSLRAHTLSSQFFWDQMHALPLGAIEKIESDIVCAVKAHFDLTLDALFFDTTNCYTYIDHGNEECSLACCGHSKEKQDNRRLFGVALLVARQGIVPLYHQVFPGNEHDSHRFPFMIQTLCERLKKLDLTPAAVTLVFDRGFNSKANFELIKKHQFGFVAAMRLGDVPHEHFAVPLRHFSRSKSDQLDGLQCYRSEVIFAGEKYSSVLYISPAFKHAQVQSLNDQLARRLEDLHEWEATILNNTDRDYQTDAKLRARRLDRLLKGPYISEILSVDYNPDRPREQRLQFSVNEKAKAKIIEGTFGRRLIITNRHHWLNEEILQTYFNQSLVEQGFRTLKDDNSIAIRPQFHWTNHSITVHAFTCYLALLLGRLLLMEARKVDANISLKSLLATLSDVRLAAMISPSATKPTCFYQLEKMSRTTTSIFNALCPNSGL